MVDLILIICLIISFIKPDLLIAKDIREKATTEQKILLVKNYRIIYSLLICMFESLSIGLRYNSLIGFSAEFVFAILFFKFAYPKTKESKELIKNIKNGNTNMTAQPNPSVMNNQIENSTMPTNNNIVNNVQQPINIICPYCRSNVSGNFCPNCGKQVQ